MDNQDKNTNDIYIWVKRTLLLIICILLIVGITNYVVDPYFHFHKPVTAYRLYDERYINDGIARHFDYNAIIIGNSLSQNFKTSQYDELFGTNSIKLPYSGAGYAELWGALGRALNYSDASDVLALLDLEDLSREANWQRYNDIPDYLYDDNIFNDARYLLNKEVLYRGTIYNLYLTLKGTDAPTFDDYSSWIRKSGPVNACASLEYINDIGDGFVYRLEDEDKWRIDENLNINVIPVIESNPETEFKLIIPPSSIAKWAEYYNKREIECRIDGLAYALPKLLGYGNVRIYAFDDEYSITTNLDLYCDTIHYDSTVNEWMLNEIHEDAHLITMDNYKEYIDNIKSFYLSYNYMDLNQYIGE